MKILMLLLVVLLAFEGKADNLKDQCKDVYFDVVPYPDDNKNFIVCAFEVPEVRTCPNASCFDVTKKNCTTDACTPVEPSDLEMAKNICKSETMDMQKIPSTDCAHFWICLSMVDPIYMACPKGLHFLRSTQECLSPALAKCMAPEKLCASGVSKTYQAENCNEYYACANKSLIKFTCPYGQAYNLQSESCVTDAAHTCVTNAKPNCKDPANTNNYYSHNECDKFYVCIQSEVYEGKCANGYTFDSKSSTCKFGSCY